MAVFIGIDVASLRAGAMDRNARLLSRHAVQNDPAAICALIGGIEGLEARSTRTSVDRPGGVTRLFCAMFAEAGLPLAPTPRLAVNRARQGIRGGERKSDPKDAAVIAELARTRPELRAAGPPGSLEAEIRLLVARRRERVTGQTRRAARLRDLLSGLFPALERRIDRTTRTGLLFLSRHAAPEDIRRAGAKRIIRRVTRAASDLEALAEDAVRAALLRQFGKTSVPRRATGGGKALRRVFYQAAFTSLGRPDSRAFCDRKRAEGKRHHQAVIALARRRGNALWAILQNRTPFRENLKLAA